MTPLTLGVLLLDSIDEPHRSVAGDYGELHTALITKAAAEVGEQIEVRSYDGRAATLPPHDARDGWLIPGSRTSVYDGDPWLPAVRDWTSVCLDRRQPLIGVCFGHQLIGQILGAPVGPSPLGWAIGAIDYDLHLAPDAVRSEQPSSDRLRLLASHRDQVLELPSGATLVASSTECPVASFVVEDHVLSVQSHPEWVPDLARSIYDSRRERIGSAAVDRALLTLDRPLDSQRVGRWIVAMLVRARRD